MSTGKPPRLGDPLSVREHEVLGLLALGCRTPEIGRRLYLSPDTVKTHLSRAYRKLGARTGPQAVAIACTRGVLLIHEQHVRTGGTTP